MKKQTGFTLIELMVVLVILGIIIGLVVPNVTGRGDEARATAAATDIKTIGNALEMYRLHNSHYPGTDQGLEALVSKPSGSPEPKNWRGPYLKQQPKDPWGNDYGYINDGSVPEIISYGADGAEGGEGVNADISSAAQ
ncbi:type II secretion system major pseudopilin GspG [Reinekea marina]|uniref:Type II secretion system major pseudopilin GspG n=1 Tax=Reinekea marina TaxID=1310421 RepID=A0ABV7WMV9_9GAMM|nr:type II secretion system major pseudopilin GspG [Reinekea marina]MBU2863290.1 type II secretion system major pseudopilin GspG [Reinekea forsetii]MDN3649505.1 type II secretion system major pseudopilin GspG [Reinekea marina]